MPRGCDFGVTSAVLNQNIWLFFRIKNRLLHILTVSPFFHSHPECSYGFSQYAIPAPLLIAIEPFDVAVSFLYSVDISLRLFATLKSEDSFVHSLVSLHTIVELPSKLFNSHHWNAPHNNESIIAPVVTLSAVMTISRLGTFLLSSQTIRNMLSSICCHDDSLFIGNELTISSVCSSLNITTPSIPTCMITDCTSCSSLKGNNVAL